MEKRCSTYLLWMRNVLSSKSRKKKENHHQAKDVAVTIMNVITSVMVASRMLEFMQRKKVNRNEKL